MWPEFRGRRKYLVENKKFFVINSDFLDPARDAQDQVQVENTMLHLLFCPIAMHCDEGLVTSLVNGCVLELALMRLKILRLYFIIVTEIQYNV